MIFCTKLLATGGGGGGGGFLIKLNPCDLSGMHIRIKSVTTMQEDENNCIIMSSSDEIETCTILFQDIVSNDMRRTWRTNRYKVYSRLEVP
jgi:hypothetical protein